MGLCLTNARLRLDRGLILHWLLFIKSDFYLGVVLTFILTECLVIDEHIPILIETRVKSEKAV